MPTPPRTSLERLRRVLVLTTIDSTAVVIAFLLEVAVLVVIQFAPSLDFTDRHLIGVSMQSVIGGLYFLTAWRTAHDPYVHPSTRRAWFWLSLAILATWIGMVIFWYLEVIVGESPFLSWSDAAYLLYYPILLFGLTRFPNASRSRFDSVKYWLDVGTVVVAGAVVLWYFAIRPDILRTAADRQVLIYTLAYPLGDVAVLAGVAVLWLRYTPHGFDRAMRWLATGLVISLAADAVYVVRSRMGTYQIGSVLDAVWACSTLLIAVSALYQRRDARRRPSVNSWARRQVKPSLLPYLAISLVFGLLIYATSKDGTASIQGLALGATAVTALVVARQIAAVRENVRLTAEAATRESEARFAALVRHSSDMIMILDADATIRYASPAAEMALGNPGSGLSGNRLIAHVHPDDAHEATRLLASVIDRGRESVRTEWRLLRADGRSLHGEHVATNLLDEPTIRGIVLNSRDVTERAELERQLTHQAFHDPLTKLANRSLFLDRLDHAFRRGGRVGGGIAVLFVDLDDFKRVNDSLGHAAGDALLVQMSDRIVRELRDGDTLARLGGDEFGVLLEDLHEAGTALAVAGRILQALTAHFVVEGKEIFVGASIGIGGSHLASSTSDLMRNADLAMYIAKTRGKGGCALYEPHMHSDVVMRLDLEADLRRAIEREEMALVFQPVVDLQNRQLVGVEALVRWPHPTRGSVSPALFIPIAEETGLILPMGRWVLREACRAARHWSDETSQSVHVGVNLSGRQIQDPGLLADVQAALEAARIDPSQLVLEITESVLMDGSGDVRGILHQLKSLGVTLALDDFGTGFSSLSYLQRFPIDLLKIDKSFVEPMSGPSYDPRLVRAILALGESLGLRIVAEGIETTAQLQALRALGCAMGQGYLFARPMTSEELVRHIRQELAQRPPEQPPRRLSAQFAAG